MPTPILHAVMHRRSARIAQLPNGLPVAFLERAEADGWAWDYRTREPFRVVALGEILSDEAAWLRVLGEDVLHVFERSAVSSSGYARAACGRYLVATIDRTPLDLSQRHMKCLACDELLPESARGPAPAWAEAPAPNPSAGRPQIDSENRTATPMKRARVLFMTCLYSEVDTETSESPSARPRWH